MKEENIKKIVWGGIYSCKDRHPCYRYGDIMNDQKYGIWIPLCYSTKNEKGEEIIKYGMIDTYQVPCGILFSSEKYKDEIEKLSKFDSLVFKLTKLKDSDNGRYVRSKAFDYYYSAFVELDNYNFKNFELIADLHDYKTTYDAESKNYKEEDILRNVRLYFEHAYPYGLDLLKKDAKIDYEKKLNNVVREIYQDIKTPKSVNDYCINNLKKVEQEVIENNCNYDKEKVEKIIKLNEFVFKLENEYKEYLKDNEINYSTFN